MKIIIAVAKNAALEGLTFHEFNNQEKANIFEEIWKALGYFTNQTKKEP